MEIPLDVHLILCDMLVDSRCLYLTCKWLYDRCKDKTYWTARHDQRLKHWLPKIKTKYDIGFFARCGNLEMVKFLLTPAVEDRYDDQRDDSREEISPILEMIYDLDRRDPLDSALWEACASLHGFDVVKFLVDSGRCTKAKCREVVFSGCEYVIPEIRAYVLED